MRLNAVNTRKYAPVLHTNSHAKVILEREKGTTRVVELSSHVCSSFPSSVLSSVVALSLRHSPTMRV